MRSILFTAAIVANGCSTGLPQPADANLGSLVDFLFPSPEGGLQDAGAGRDGSAEVDAGPNAADASTTEDLQCVGSPAVITGSPAVASLCQGAMIAVPYQVTGCVKPGNSFTLQLSDVKGDFTNFLNIGSLKATMSGTVTGTIPVGIPPGAGYRVRAVALSPYAVGTDNGVDLTVHSRPSAGFTFTPQAVVTDGTPVHFSPDSLNEAKYAWDFGAGAAPANSGSVKPSASYSTSGLKVVTLTVSSVDGCEASSSTQSFEGAPGSLAVYSCNPLIPPTANVVRGMVQQGGGGMSDWLCGGASLMAGGGEYTVFVEPGADFVFTGGGGYHTYVRNGGSYNGQPGGFSVVIFEAGAGVAGSYSLKLQCPKLTFDYSVAPQGGCQAP